MRGQERGKEGKKEGDTENCLDSNIFLVVLKASSLPKMDSLYDNIDQIENALNLLILSDLN